ncbi:hypothetical protein MASR2M48_07140 [Spirochaetota bacterium]
MYRKSVIFILILISTTLYIHAQTTLETDLLWIAGKDTVIFNESVSENSSGYIAILKTSVGEYDRQVMDKQRSVLEWQRSDATEGTDIQASRLGSQVIVKGIYKGKPFEKKHDFGSLPWYQLHEASYETLYKSGINKLSFWTIDRKTLRATEFKAERQSEENITIMGRPIPAVKYSLGISGIPAFLFQAHFWLRNTDGRFLRLDAPAILGLPKSSVELTSEKLF